MTSIERFFDKVLPEPNSGCWLWTGAVNSKGYGSFSLDGKLMTAHRASWLIHKRRGTGGLMICHRCDTRTCVNPDHMFLGTNTDNQRDSIQKGRRPPTSGEMNPRARLSESDAVAILQDTRTQKVIAAQYGVSTSTVAMIKSGRNWPHLRRTAE